MRILVFIFLTSISKWTYAQDYFVSGGAVVSKMYSITSNQFNSGLDDFEPVFGFTVGVSRIFELSKSSEKLILTTEVMFTRLGSKYNFGDDNSIDPILNNVDDDYIRTSYLYLAIPLQYKVSKLFEVGLGPQLGYQLSRKIDSNSGIDRNEFDSRVDYGVVFDARFNMTHKLSLNAKIYNGFGNVEKIEFIDWKSKNRYMSLCLAYRFSIN